MEEEPKTMAQAFPERLLAAGRGEIPRTEVLEPFLLGLEQMLLEFEAALDFQPTELVELLDGYLEAISEAVQTCQDLAIECLEKDSEEEVFLELHEAHEHLNQLFLDFHRECWLYRGPTEVDWLNILLDAGERFLGGEELPRSLTFILQDQVRNLEVRLAAKPALEGEALLSALRQLQSWSSGQESLTRDRLQGCLARVKDSGHRATGYLTEERVSLESLILSLDEGPSPKEVEEILRATLEELGDLRVRLLQGFEGASAELQSSFQDLIQRLRELESLLLLIDPNAGLSSIVEELMTIYEDLEEEIRRLQEAALNEGTIPCPDCGERNSRLAKRCGACSKILAAQVGLEHEIDFSESAEQGEENVRRFRLACRRFQTQTLSLSQFQAHLSSFKELFHVTLCQAEKPKGSHLFTLLEEAKEHIFSSLRILEAVELPNDQAVEDALTRFQQGVSLLRELRSLSTS